ncbi:MAG: segregation/condensation protein A [Clostridia bacterium]|nr:segregation/condensation protein A [Clostridia bacterium]
MPKENNITAAEIETLSILEENEGLTFSLEEVFEGPLDLLLALIAKNKVSIYDIPIQLIFEQYMDYIAQMEMFNMEVASSFIVMAAQLMVIKSRMLLPPKEDDEEDPRQELVDMLLEYQKAKETASELHDRELTYMGRFEKPPEKIESEPEYSLLHDIQLLKDAFVRAYSRKFASEELAPIEEPIDELITATRQISVTEKINSVVSVLKTVKRTTLGSVFLNSETKHELVATFLALLELIKGRRVTVIYLKEEDYADCDIQYNEDAEDSPLEITTDDIIPEFI